MDFFFRLKFELLNVTAGLMKWQITFLNTNHQLANESAFTLLFDDIKSPWGSEWDTGHFILYSWRLGLEF